MNGQADVSKGGGRIVWILPVTAGALWTLQGVIRVAARCSISDCFGDQLPLSTPSAAVSQLSDFAQEIGTFNLLIGLLIIFAAWIGLKRGQRWGWYVTLWFFVTVLADFSEIGNPIYLFSLILAGAALALSYGKFFPKKQL